MIFKGMQNNSRAVLVQYAGQMYAGYQWRSKVLQVSREIPKINFSVVIVNVTLRANLKLIY